MYFMDTDPSIGRPNYDFFVYYVAGRDWRLSLDPYSRHPEQGEFDYATGTTGKLDRYIYPPTLLPLYGALSSLSYDTARSIWLAVNILTFCAAVAVAAALARARWLEVVTAAALITSAMFGFLYAMRQGQIDLFVSSLAIIAFLLYGKARSWPTAVLLALAMLTKVVPSRHPDRDARVLQRHQAARQDRARRRGARTALARVGRPGRLLRLLLLRPAGRHRAGRLLEQPLPAAPPLRRADRRQGRDPDRVGASRRHLLRRRRAQPLAPAGYPPGPARDGALRRPPAGRGLRPVLLPTPLGDGHGVADHPRRAPGHSAATTRPAVGAARGGRRSRPRGDQPDGGAADRCEPAERAGHGDRRRLARVPLSAVPPGDDGPGRAIDSAP